MRTNFIRTLCIGMLALVCVGARAVDVSEINRTQQEREEGSLFPGQAYTYKGVSMTWQPDKSGATTPTLGNLAFVGRKNRIAVDLKGIDAVHGMYTPSQASVYIDDAMFQIDRSGPKEQVRFTVHSQDHNVSFGPLATAQMGLYVSAVCPVRLDEWRIGISAAPVKYPDGHRYYEVQALNTKTSEDVRVPAVEGTKRKIGRFQIEVIRFSDLARTATISVTAEIDKSLRGADAYIENGKFTGQPAGEFLTELGKRCGFDVEWVPNPSGNPVSIAFAQKWALYPPGWGEEFAGPLSAKQLVERYLDNRSARSRIKDQYDIGYEWKDNTHLRVWAKNYEKYLAQKAENERKAAEYSSEEKQFGAIFDSKYKAETRAYPLAKISPSTAKTLVESELATYCLFPIPDPAGGRAVERGKDFSIASFPRGSRIQGVEIVARKTDEYAIADDKAGAILVCAVPATQGKVQEILARVDGLLAAEKKGANLPPPKRYRLEVILLQSDQGKPTSGTRLSSYGLSEDDVKLFGFDVVSEVGRGVVTLSGERGDTGKALVGLNDTYSAEFEFQDVRSPYLIAKGRLAAKGAEKDAAAKPLLENTLFLEKGKPSVLGLTNLRQALILIVRLHDEPK